MSCRPCPQLCGGSALGSRALYRWILTLPLASSLTFGGLQTLRLSFLICRMKVLMVPVSLGALMIMYMTHLAWFLSHCKCSVSVTPAFGSFLSYSSLSHPSGLFWDENYILLIFLLSYLYLFSLFGNFRIVSEAESLLASMTSLPPVWPQTSLGCSFLLPDRCSSASPWASPLFLFILPTPELVSPELPSLPSPRLT